MIPKPMRRISRFRSLSLRSPRVVASGVFGVAALLAVVVTRDPPVRHPVEFGTAPAVLQADQPRPNGLSATWLCPGVPATPDSPGSVVVDNPSDQDAGVSVSFMPSQGTVQQRTESIRARSRVELALSELAPAPFTAVVVESTSVALLVEQRAVSQGGSASAPCMTSTSDHWYQADGTTSRDAASTLLLFNPFPADAVMDLQFVTEEGQAQQRGISVKAGSLRAVDLGEEGTRRKQSVAMTVDVISGRVVAGRVTTFDGTGERAGIIAGPLSPALGTKWLFADGLKADGVTERVVVYNPGDKRVEAQIELYPDASPDAAVPVIAPLPVSIAPQGTTSVDLSAAEQVPGGRHRIIVTSLNDEPFVVERVVDAAPAAGARGSSSVFGSQLTSSQWWFADGSTVGGRHLDVVVANLTGSPSTVTVSVLGPGGATPIAEASDVALAPAGSVVFDLAALRPGAAVLPLVIDASGPVVVERISSIDGSVGLSRSLGLPSTAGAGSPPAALISPMLPGDTTPASDDTTPLPDDAATSVPTESSAPASSTTAST